MPTSCWLCDQPISDPPEVIGRWLAGQARVVHRVCLTRLAEAELDFQRADDTGPGFDSRRSPGRP